MRAAFHFDAELFGGYYGPPILETLFRALLAPNLGRLHVRIRCGDLLLSTRDGVLDPEKVLKSLLYGDYPVWFTVDPASFLLLLGHQRIYVLDVEGLSDRQATKCDELLKSESGYIGALQIQPANPVHWGLYDQRLIPRYRIHAGELRMLHTSEVTDEDRDTGMMDHWRSLDLFEEVNWEDIGVRGTIFDDYDTYDHARRRAEVQMHLSEQFEGLTTELLLRTEDLDPRLADALHAAFRALDDVDSSEELAHVALSCRRFLTKLADALYPPREEHVGGREVSSAQYRNRLWAYARQHLTETARDVALTNLEDVDNRVRRINDLANRGLHGDIGDSELQRMLLSLVALAHDLVSLDRPPYALSLEPHEEGIKRILRPMLEEPPGQ